MNNDPVQPLFPMAEQCFFCDWGKDHPLEREMLVTIQCHCGQPHCKFATPHPLCPRCLNLGFGQRMLKQLTLESMKAADSKRYIEMLDELLEEAEDPLPPEGFMMPEISL